MKTDRLTGKYVLPTVEKLDICVERGFAFSVDYGDEGVAGDDFVGGEDYDI